MPYNIKQLGEKSVSIDFFIADPSIYIRQIPRGHGITITYSPGFNHGVFIRGT